MSEETKLARTIMAAISTSNEAVHGCDFAYICEEADLTMRIDGVIDLKLVAKELQVQGVICTQEMSRAQYEASLDAAFVSARSGNGWNGRFLKALSDQGLELKPVGYTDPKGLGRDIWPPIPQENDDSGDWEYGQVIGVKE